MRKFYAGLLGFGLATGAGAVCAESFAAMHHRDVEVQVIAEENGIDTHTMTLIEPLSPPEAAISQFNNEANAFMVVGLMPGLGSLAITGLTIMELVKPYGREPDLITQLAA